MTRPAWAEEPELSVFVNCPFDARYETLLDAIVLACMCSGIVPWMAGSSGSVSVPRVERILEGLSHCRYSIHDLSRFEGEGPANLSRFNMPLELGIAMAQRGRTPGQDSHDWMVLAPEGHAYQQYVSDLAGFDPFTHDGSPQRVAMSVLSWLETRPTVSAFRGPEHVLERLPEYTQRRQELDTRWSGRSPWGRVISLAAEIAGS